MVAVCILPSIEDSDSIRRIIINETGNALVSYFDEPSLMYVKELGGLTREVCFGIMVIFVILTLTLIGCVIWFIINVSRRKGKSTVLTKTAKSLIVSSLIQGFLCCIFLFTPMGSLAFIWAFRIEGSANIVNSVSFFVSVYGTVDLISILYFVKPYRVYCWKLFLKLTVKLSRKNNVIPISTIATF
uniref:G_PROTEIN_RECEP_F1_2 domain-containing protein n=1 Tax=Panagrellus redivivus TaxID=6233 RepID=A0A7E4WCF8_PANRE